jgi:hypothetical protein
MDGTEPPAQASAASDRAAGGDEHENTQPSFSRAGGGDAGRVACARARASRAAAARTTDLAIEQVAAEAGFGSAAVMREHFGTVVGTSHCHASERFPELIARRKRASDQAGSKQNGSLDRAGHLRHRVTMEATPSGRSDGGECSLRQDRDPLKAGGTRALNFPLLQKIKLTAIVKGRAGSPSTASERLTVRLRDLR